MMRTKPISLKKVTLIVTVLLLTTIIHSIVKENVPLEIKDMTDSISTKYLDKSIRIT